jgi:metal-responsive CopG/Arc/MetJ family transcriptional regulator
MVIWKKMKRFTLALPEELMINLDGAAKDYYMSRSEYIRLELHKAVVAHYERQKANKEHIDTLPQGLENDPRIFDVDDS